MKNFNPESIDGSGLRTNLRSSLEYVEDELNKIHFWRFNGAAVVNLNARFDVHQYPPAVLTNGYTRTKRIPKRWVAGGKFKIVIYYSGSASSANNYSVQLLASGQRDLGVINVDSSNVHFSTFTMPPLSAPFEVKRHELYSSGNLAATDDIIALRFRRNVDTNLSDLYLMCIWMEYEEPYPESGS